MIKDTVIQTLEKLGFWIKFTLQLYISLCILYKQTQDIEALHQVIRHNYLLVIFSYTFDPLVHFRQ